MRRPPVRKWAVPALCGGWICWAVWTQFLTLPSGDVENHSSLSVKERMNDCAGTFQQRYDCKNSIVIETDRSTFVNMVGRLIVVVLPPLLLIGLINLRAPRRREEDESAGGDEWNDPSHYRRRYHRRTSGRHD